MPESVFLNTGCVPDYVYMGGLILLGLLGWRMWRNRTRMTAEAE